MGFHDECGVAGIYGADNASRFVYYALNSLQHRGQESAGIAVCTELSVKSSSEDSECKIKLHKGMGLTGDVFKAEHFKDLDGNIALGHVRYATAGGRTIENAQPFVNTYKFGSIALAHNGQLVNHTELRSLLEDSGSTFNSTSDSEVILKLIVRKFIDRGGKPGHSLTEDYEENKKRFEQAIVETASLIKGSFALCIMTSDCLIAVRDPGGIRPLCLGQIKNNCASLKSSKSENSYIVASESCAIDSVNGTFLRDIAPGEIVIINREGLRSIKYSESPKQTCIFEYVYFARPDSIIDGVSVQEARYNMGSILAKESPVEADVIIGVPDSGIGAAMGYAKESGIPYV
ncbi:MAG: class II glutamine amidotransferase, partial [Treponema sp.]|nr:class II glutamine amidotransferase [Treponema sp.]